MQAIAGIVSTVVSSVAAPGRLVVLHRRLLITASVLVPWYASILALQAIGPHDRSMIATEGMLIAASELSP